MLIRPALPDDAPELVEIINAIINAGHKTAHQTPFTSARMMRTYVAPDRLISCHLAEIDGRPVGFQSLMWPDDTGQNFPEHWAIIASFVDAKAAGKGVARALFEATRASAQDACVATIDATIRADNVGGLGYYSKMGFEDYDVLPAVPLRDGTLVDRIRKKYAL